MTQYPPGGILFYQTEKRNEKAPDFNGNVEIDQDILNWLQAQIATASDGRAKLRLAGWRRQGRSGKDFISLKPDISEYKPRQDGVTQGNQAPAKPRNYDDEIPF